MLGTLLRLGLSILTCFRSGCHVTRNVIRRPVAISEQGTLIRPLLSNVNNSFLLFCFWPIDFPIDFKQVS